MIITPEQRKAAVESNEDYVKRYGPIWEGERAVRCWGCGEETQHEWWQHVIGHDHYNGKGNFCGEFEGVDWPEA